MMFKKVNLINSKHEMSTKNNQHPRSPTDKLKNSMQAHFTDTSDARDAVCAIKSLES